MKKGILISLVALGVAAAAPVTTDKWDSSQAGFGGLTTSTPVGACAPASNLFGTTGGCESTSVLLAEVANQTNTFTWNTNSFTLTSFDFYYSSDGGNSNLRLVNRLQLAYWDGTQFMQYYDSGVNAFPTNGSQLSVTLGAGVTAGTWQATFTNPGNIALPFIGARLVELDGFGTETPEPASFVLVGSAAIAFLAMRRRA